MNRRVAIGNWYAGPRIRLTANPQLCSAVTAPALRDARQREGGPVTGCRNLALSEVTVCRPLVAVGHAACAAGDGQREVIAGRVPPGW